MKRITGFPNKDSTAGSAPDSASYVTIAANSLLSAERVLTAGTNITISDSGPNGTITINAVPGSGVTGKATVDFGNGTDQASVTVATASALTASIIRAVMSYDPTGVRDRDELEMDNFEVKVGNIVNATSFDLFVSCLTGYAHGTYFVNWAI
jgi:hypothetical protein